MFLLFLRQRSSGTTSWLVMPGSMRMLCFTRRAPDCSSTSTSPGGRSLRTSGVNPRILPADTHASLRRLAADFEAADRGYALKLYVNAALHAGAYDERE